MERIGETADCKSLRLFLWNEKLTRNQISQSEGLCVFIITSTYIGQVNPCERSYTVENNKCSTVIPFDLSKLWNREASLGSLLVSATLQFLPQTIERLADDICYRLFTEFQHSQVSLLPPPRPTYVVVVEISQTLWINVTDKIDLNVSPNPPDIPLYRRFENEDEGVFTVRNVTAADYRNDPFSKYTEDVLEYLDVLREYTGEGGIFPAKPPIAVDVARGFVEVQPCDEYECPWLVKNLIDETCPICYEEFKDENEGLTTSCSHTFHIRCLLPWLSKNNSCPTCRAVYPLHYSPLLDCQRRKRKHNMLEANV